MSIVKARISISVDGYTAGPNQSEEHPLGEGGDRLHDWAFPPGGTRSDVDADVLAEADANIGAYIMGRNMFGPVRGPWRDDSWRGWWGEDPPYHTPVFVLTHHAREPLEMEGGTTFHFVTDGIESALDQARAAAGDRDVSIAGGAQCLRQYLRAGLVDELHLLVAPVILGAGERLLDDVGEPSLEIADVVASPAVTHVRYRIVR
jgi:dihydrofolate reductase